MIAFQWGDRGPGGPESVSGAASQSDTGNTSVTTQGNTGNTNETSQDNVGETISSTIGNNGFSVRWEGQLAVDGFGFYKFYSDPVNGSARVWLNDEMIIDENSTESGTVTLFGGGENTLKVEYSHEGGSGSDAGMFLRWSNNTPVNVIPPASLIPNTDILVSSESTPELPGDFELRQNYPNPFNPVTQIEFNLPAPGDIKLSIFNTLGQEVQVLARDKRTAGRHTVTFDASSLPSGMYLYRLEYGGQTLVRKMMLLK